MNEAKDQRLEWTIRRHELLLQNKALASGDLGVRVKYEVSPTAHWTDANERIILRNEQWIADLDVLLSLDPSSTKDVERASVIASNGSTERS